MIDKEIKIFKDVAGEWRWHVVAANNKIIADSGESYINKSDCVRSATTLFPGVEMVEVDAH